MGTLPHKTFASNDYDRDSSSGGYVLRFYWIFLLAFTLLALPCVLFFAGWYEWYIALPLIIVIGWSVRHGMRGCKDWVWRVTRKDLLKLAVVFLLILIQQFSVGYTGIVMQHGDFWQRNAFYGNLISYAWPIVLPDGAEMSYYLAGWLPAAMCCKLFSHAGVDVECLYGVPGYVLLFWNVCVLFVGYMVLFYMLGRVSILMLIWIYIFGDVMTSLVKIPLMSGLLNLMPESTIVPRYWNIASGLVSSFNIVPMTVLATALVLTRGFPFWGYALVGAFLFLISPLGAVGLLPFVVYKAFYTLRHDGCMPSQYMARIVKCGYFYVPVAVCCAGILYFARAKGAGCYYAFDMDGRVLAWFAFFVYMLVNIAVFCYIPWRCDRKNPLLYCSLITLCCLPFLYMGDIFNELSFKGMTAPIIVLAVLWCQAFLQCRSKFWTPISVAIICLFVMKLGGHLYQRGVLVKGSWGQTMYNVIDPFQGHLFHPSTSLNQSIRPTSEPMIPHVLLRKAGASEDGLLFWMDTQPSDKYYSAPYKERGDRPSLGKPMPEAPRVIR